MSMLIKMWITTLQGLACILLIEHLVYGSNNVGNIKDESDGGSQNESRTILENDIMESMEKHNNNSSNITNNDWNPKTASLNQPESQTSNSQGNGNQSHDQKNVKITNTVLMSAWQHMCTIKYGLITGSNFTSQNSFIVSCDLNKSDHWSLYDYRKWISANEKAFYKYLPINENLHMAFEFECHDSSSSLILPKPAKANYLWYVSVTNCVINDYLGEYDISIDIPDVLRVLEFKNCDLKIDRQYSKLLRGDSTTMSKQFDCGSEILERYVERNCTYTSTEDLKSEINGTVSINDSSSNASNDNPSQVLDNVTFSEDIFSSITSESEMMNAIAKLGQEYQKLHHKCVFKNLQYIDESYSSNVAKHHSNYMVERKQYPALKYYNMSHSKLTTISENFLQWRRYFPKIMYLDFSYNRIKYFSTLSDHGLQYDSAGVLDLRHNNITTLTLEDLDTLRAQRYTVQVDIRGNPLNCDCKLLNFINELKKSSRKIPAHYSYLKDMKCFTPEKFKDEIISDLTAEICENLEVILLKVPLAILGTLLLIVISILVLTIKCRREIMIIAYTRFQIRLPCRKIIQNVNKNYDAFIAYSEEDGDWVFNNLIYRLEMRGENKAPNFKLCVHHRDFPVGGCIAENIVTKIQESYHTILVLSNHFLMSNWCKYEFKTALQQSIEEKKKHLIIIITEELDKKLIDSELNRCLKTFTYLKVDDRLFWDKLIFALSDHERVNQNEKPGVNENIIEINDMDNIVLGDNEHKIIEKNNVIEEQLYEFRQHYNRNNHNIIQNGIWII